MAAGGSAGSTSGTSGTGGQAGAASSGEVTGGAATGGSKAAGGSAGHSAGGGTTGSGGHASGGSSGVDASGADLALADAKGPNAADAAGAFGATVTFHNGVFWNDNDSKRIEAHGGGFLKVADTWYWFGEDKSKNSSLFNAVNCYASKDLVTWEFRRAVVTHATAAQLNTSDLVIERPKVIYNETTKQFVLWVHWDNSSYGNSQAAVFTSTTVDGDYTFVKQVKPLGNDSRDCTLFKDDDGTAYFMGAAHSNADMMVYQLTDDYLDVKQLTVKMPGSYRESPTLLKTNGTYFMITSGTTGWSPNQAQYTSASAMAGPWSSLTNIGDNTTFQSQPTYVITVAGSAATTFIYAGDRWQGSQLVNSQYIWLSLVVTGKTLSMSYAAQWTLDLGTGR